MKKTRQEKGITLIALIITIVVLLILAVVAIRAVQGDGIIQYARNARNDYEQAQANEQAMLDNYISQIEGSLSEETKITWTKTSEGDLAIGSTIKTSTNEEFYVIGGDTVGTPITSSTVKVILLAKNNLKVDGSAQDPTGAFNTCAFSTVENLSFTTEEDLNKNSTIKADTTSAVYKAMKYGETLGVTTGRLMLPFEIAHLDANGYSDITYLKSSSTLKYWLGSADDANGVYLMYDTFVETTTNFGYSYGIDELCGVRPVIEIPISNIS